MMDENKTIHIQEKPDSVNIKETAKGDLYFDVKCYGNAQDDPKELIDRAENIYNSLVNRMRGLETEEKE